MKLKIFSLIISVTVLFSAFIPFASATVEPQDRISLSMDSFRDPEGGILGVSSKGEWGEYPENSLPAIEKAAQTDIDFVAVDVKRTVDGAIILFSDDTTERMLDSEDIFTVANTAYSVLSAYKLRNAAGGSNEGVTDITIPTLSEAVDTARENDIPLMIRCASALIPEVTAVLTEKDALGLCVILTDGKIKEIGTALAGYFENSIADLKPIGNGVSSVKEFVDIKRRDSSIEGSFEKLKSFMEAKSWMRLRNTLYYVSKKQPESTSLAVQCIKIGNTLIACLPGEVYTEFGRQIKAASPFENTIVVENCNTYCGYIPTAEAFDPAHDDLYETSLCYHSCHVPEAGSIITGKALELANKIYK